jgi:1-acyl-sn-glycerol-3-phosphate acyltransferase
MSSPTTRIPHSSHPLVYRCIRFSAGAIMRIIYRYRVVGVENIPAEGTTIFAMNHLHLLDPCAAGAAVTRQVVVMAADKWLTNWFVRSFLNGVGTIYVRRGEADRAALRASLEVLNAGGAMALAPEGTRSRRGTLQRAKPGIAYLATRTNAMIVPVACWGVENLSDWKRLKRPSCTVAIGVPFRHEYPGKATSEQLQAYADEIMIRVAALLPEQYRGVYAGLQAPSAVEGAAHTAPAMVQD